MDQDVVQLADLVLKLADQVNFYWNFYVFAIIAILGWLLALKNDPGPHLKVLLTIGFFIFVAMNITGLLRAYAFLEAVSSEMRLVAKSVSFATTLLPERISKIDYAGYKIRIYVPHLLVDSAVLFTIWSNRLRQALRVAGA